MAIDPKDRKKEREDKGWSEDGPGTIFLKMTGRWPMAVCGWEYFKSSAKGTPGLMVRLVIVEGEQAGAVIDTDFWLTEKALVQLADFALAFGYEEPFNEKSDDDIERIVSFGVGVINVVVKAEHYAKQNSEAGIKYRPAFFSRYRGAKKDTWEEYEKKGTDSFKAYCKWREANPRPEPGQPRQERQQAQRPQQQRDEGRQDDGGGGSYVPEDDGGVPF